MHTKSLQSCLTLCNSLDHSPPGSSVHRSLQAGLLECVPMPYLKILYIFCCCSVAQWCPTVYNPMDCSTPGFPVHHLPDAQTHVHWISGAIQPSRPLSSPSPPALNLSQHQSNFPMSWLFASGGQNTVASASASVLSMTIQGWFPLGLTGLIPLDVQGTLKSLLQHHNLKASSLWCSTFFMVQLLHIHDYWKNHSFDYMDLHRQII